MTDTANHNRSGYDRWAATYDSAVNSTVACDDMHFPALWADVRDKDVLEIGCGTGRHTLRLADQGNRVTAIDLSPGMLAVAQQKLAGFDVRFVEHDLMTASLNLGRFDAVVAALVLEHISDAGLFFQRVVDSLRPGGEVFLSEVEPSRLAAGAQARFFGDDGEEHRLASFCHAGPEIVAAAAHAGLTLQSEQDVVGDERLAALNPKWAKHLGRPMIRMWRFRL